MHLSISSRELEIPPAMYAYIAAKMQHVAQCCPNISACYLFLSADAYDYTIEATVHQLDEKLALTATGSNLYVAMDAIARQVVRQAKTAALPAMDA